MIQMDEAVNMLVGNPTADSEHLELILLINLIYAYSNNKIYKSAVPGLVVLFTTKLLSHCKSEEKVLAEMSSYTLGEHTEEHVKLISKTTSMLEEISLDTIKSFEQMLKDHIRDYDMVGFSS